MPTMLTSTSRCSSSLRPNTSLNGNQTSVANALVGYFNRNGGIPLVYGGLTAAGLTQASGSVSTAVQPTMVQAMTLFMTTLTDLSGRGPGAPRATGFAEEGDAMNAYAAVRLRGSDGETFGLVTKAAPRAPATSWRASPSPVRLCRPTS